MNPVIPKEAIELAIAGGWDDTNAAFATKDTPKGQWEYDWQVVALDPSFWQALGKALKFDQPIWHCKSYEKMCVVDGKETGERRCESDFCEYAGYKNLDPTSQYSKVHDFLHLILTGHDTAAYWQELLPE